MPPGSFTFCVCRARAHVDRGEAVGLEPLRVEAHVDPPRAPAEDRDLADAVDGLELPAQDLVGELGRLAERAASRQGDGEDRRRVGVELLHDRLVDVARQVREDAVHLVAHLLRGDVHVLLEDERDEDLRDALGGDRLEVVDARDRVDRLLDLVGDLGLDLLRRGAREPRDDGDGGEVDARVPVDAEARVADSSDDDERDDEHRREDGPADAETGECLHGLVSFRRSVGALDLEAVHEAAVGAHDDAFARRDAGPHLEGVAVAVSDRDDALDDARRPEDEDVRDARIRDDGGRRHEQGLSLFGRETRAVTKRPGFRTWRGFGTIASTTSVRASERRDGPM